MAMCASGSIGILSAPQGGCSSISLAACGTTTGPQCLTALATATGKANCMSAFYSYDDTMIVTPTSITSIPAACTTCVITTCAPAFNTACVCTACTWLVPATPVTPAPAGNTHNVVICANAGAARCGTVCYVSVCGGNCPVTFCQVAGVTWNCIYLCHLGGGGCGSALASAAGCLTPAISVAGDCYCVCICGILRAACCCGTSCAVISITCGAGSKLCCCVGVGGAACCPSVSFCVLCGNNVNYSLTACHQCAGCCGTAISCICLVSITKIVGCYCQSGVSTDVAATY